jgi:hypothetical protein
MDLVKRAFTCRSPSAAYEERGRSGDAKHDANWFRSGAAAMGRLAGLQTQSGADTFRKRCGAVVERPALPRPRAFAGGQAWVSIRRHSCGRRRRDGGGGKKIVKVEDRVGTMSQVTTLNWRSVPGRDIVVPTEDRGGVLDTYVLASSRTIRAR